MSSDEQVRAGEEEGVPIENVRHELEMILMGADYTGMEKKGNYILDSRNAFGVDIFLSWG